MACALYDCGLFRRRNRTMLICSSALPVRVSGCDCHLRTEGTNAIDTSCRLPPRSIYAPLVQTVALAEMEMGVLLMA